jgi:hypothetical protein
MAQSLKAPPSQDFLQKTLGAQLAAGATSAATLNNTTGIQNLPGVMIIDRVDSNGVETPNKVEVILFTGTSGSTVVTLTRGQAGTSDQAHEINAVVEFSPDVMWAQSVYDALTQLIAPSTGLLDTTKVVDLTTAQTLTNKRLTSPKINEDVALTASATELNLLDGVTALPSGDGWTPYTAVTPTSGTLDDPSFELTFAGVDLSTTLYPGMRVKLTQSTVKYFIITKVAFSTNTTVTVYGGTDYDLVSTGTTAITAFSYSTSRAPAGFPMDPTKWTVETTDTTQRSQASPTSGTWYNLGTKSIEIPIGVWDVSYQVSQSVERQSTGNMDVSTTLSTANNSQSDADFTSYALTAQLSSGTMYLNTPAFRQKILSLAAKTTYYLNTKTDQSSIATLYNNNGASKLLIKAVCAYL